MTTRPPRDPVDPASLLAELGSVQEAARRAARSTFTGRPLAAWGVAWLVGYSALGAVDGPWRWVLAIAAWVGACAVSWGSSPVARAGHEDVARRAWLAVLLASPLLVAVVDPPDLQAAGIFLGSLWALAMLILGVCTRDRALTALAVLVLGIAVAARHQSLVDPLVAFGVPAGTAMAGLGTWRAAMAGRRR